MLIFAFRAWAEAAHLETLGARWRLAEPWSVRSHRARRLAFLQWHFSITLMRTELVTTLKRQATELLSELERHRDLILITQHGIPSAYLVDVQTYETLQTRMTLLEGIARGEKAVEDGRTFTHAQARKRMARWLK